VVSVGSTPTATYAEDLAGVTEVRAGVFVFFDLVMRIAVCALDDIAISVLASVIGHHATRLDHRRRGWMAMSRDRGTQTKLDQGYGLVCDALGRPMQT